MANGRLFDGLDGLLRYAGGVVRRDAMLAEFLGGVWFLGLVCLVMLWVDAMVDLAVVWRVLLDGVWVGLLLWWVWRVLCVFNRYGYEPRRMARWVEIQIGIGDSRLINAVGLANDAGGVDSVAMRRAVVARGDMAAREIDRGLIVAERSWGRGLFFVLILLAVVLGSAGVGPRVWRAVVPRFLMPMLDGPGYTWLNFEVVVDPEGVLAGQRMAIETRIEGDGGWVDRIRGSLPRRAWVVWAGGDDGEGGGLGETPMHWEGEGQFSLSVDRAVDGFRFYVETDAGRSGWMDVSVVLVDGASVDDVGGADGSVGNNGDRGGLGLWDGGGGGDGEGGDDGRGQGGGGGDDAGGGGAGGNGGGDVALHSEADGVGVGDGGGGREMGVLSEGIEPGAEDEISVSVRPLDGVPGVYRELVQKYFRRLAEDAVGGK